VGGNGRWRQKRAKEQWILDQAAAEKQRQERQILEAEKKRRMEEREAIRRKQEEEDQQRRRLSEDKKRREQLAQEERERQEEEERRLKEQQEHSEWLARQPKTCTTCMGSGKCTHCGGTGSYFTMFLAPSVGTDAILDFGRMQQGCPECGGCAQNIRGDLLQGSGRCLNCDGVGMVTPVVERHRKSLTKTMTNTSVRKTHSGQDLHVHSLRSPVASENSRRSCLSPAEASRRSIFSPSP
jgi:flagellar biosynthesis GTPase FlhF